MIPAAISHAAMVNANRGRCTSRAIAAAASSDTASKASRLMRPFGSKLRGAWVPIQAEGSAASACNVASASSGA